MPTTARATTNTLCNTAPRYEAVARYWSFFCCCTCVAFQAYQIAPNRTDLLLLMGAVCYQLGNWEQCILLNDRCICLDSGLAEAHANLANALQQIGSYDMAIIYYQV